LGLDASSSHDSRSGAVGVSTLDSLRGAATGHGAQVHLRSSAAFVRFRRSGTKNACTLFVISRHGTFFIARLGARAGTGLENRPHLGRM
jgi:hypothetical protein